MARTWNRWAAMALLAVVANTAAAGYGQDAAQTAQKDAAVQGAAQKDAAQKDAVQKGAAGQKAGAVQKGAAGPAPAIKYMTRTVLRPTFVTEKRMVTETHFNAVEKTRTVQVCRQVPETKQVKQTYVEIERRPMSREETYPVHKPVYETVEQKFQVTVPHYHDVERTYQIRVPVYRDEQREVTVMVPHTEMREGVRKHTKMVPVTVMKKICRDAGHWETRVSTVCVTPVHRHGCGLHCGGYGHCAPPVPVTTCRRVWVPKLVEEQIPVTTYQCQVESVPCTYAVTVMKPEKQMRTFRVCDYKIETKKRMERVCEYKVETKTRPVQVCRYETQMKKRTVHYVECVPVTKTRLVDVTTYKTVVEDRQEKYIEYVPEHTQKEVEVTVCKLVPHEETVPVHCVPVHCGCYSMFHYRHCY